MNAEKPPLSDFLSEASFRCPDWVPPFSRWAVHAPFAFWFVETLRPHCLVELGVGRGDSYMTFCQAVREASLRTQCYGVDPWIDPESPAMGETMFCEVQTWNHQTFADFSHLIRAPLPEALRHFPDGSIDLLHWNQDPETSTAGEDFTAWLPKMSARGVILVHQIRQNHTARIWQRLKTSKPFFEFPHGAGLGVAAMGSALPQTVQVLFAGSDPSVAETIRQTYARLGQTVGAPPFSATGPTTGDQHGEHLPAWENQWRLRENTTATLIRRLEEQIQNLDETRTNLQGRNNDLEAALASVAVWQKSWWRRATRRWHRMPAGEAPGFFARMARSLQKRGLLPGTLQSNEPKRDLPENPSSPPSENAIRETPAPKDPDPKDFFRQRREEEWQAFRQSGETLRLPLSPQPRISILIILYNQAALTFACLRALQTETVPMEIFLVNNASTDETAHLLRRVEGARVFTNPENTGFLLAVNQAAAQARGDYLLLLNNDAIPRPHSIDRALATMETSPQIGAVGGRLILPDGTLQEAGSIMWSDATCLGYGRGKSPEDGRFAFRRDVDYCSAAFLLLRKSHFEELGGFDPEFAPAYYEESDFCLRLHAAGYRVVYEPEAVVDHFEFGSSSKASETVAQLQRNAERLRTKHQKLLAKQPPPGPHEILQARSRPSDGKRILFLDDLLPLNSNGAGCPRALAMVKALHEAGHFVTFLALRDGETDWDSIYAALPREIEVLPSQDIPMLETFFSKRQGFYHAILVSRPHNMEALLPVLKENPLWFCGTRILYDAEAVFALREIRKADILGNPLDPDTTSRILEEETRLAARAAVVSVTSEREAICFRDAGISDVEIVSHGLEVRPGPGSFHEREGFLFVGRLAENDSPNTDSMLWFLVKILPLIQAQLGREVPVHIAGKNTGCLLMHLNDAGLRFYGVVEDLTEHYNAARVFIAPTRYASGVPLKILEAAAHGLPVVGTSLLAAQLGWESGRELLASDQAAEFAALCCELYTNSALWTSLRENGLARMRRDHSPEDFARRVVSLVE